MMTFLGFALYNLSWAMYMGLLDSVITFLKKLFRIFNKIILIFFFLNYFLCLVWVWVWFLILNFLVLYYLHLL